LVAGIPVFALPTANAGLTVINKKVKTTDQRN